MENPAIWGQHATDAFEIEKVRVFEQMIPSSVESILDVGCGDGRITDALAERWKVVGLDSSREALAHVKSESVLGDACCLPFRDASFDLALSSQMLEHLDDTAYTAALHELGRVTSSYLLLSVPFREDLGMRQIRCCECGLRQHVWGHLRRFDADSLLRDLPGFEAVDVRLFGEVQDPAWPKPLLSVIHNVFRGWYSSEGQNPQCARCGNSDFSQMRSFPPHSARVKSLSDRISNKPRMPFWITVLATLRDNERTA
jgi:SAM-dependent methyltransferase